jgi:hypothetical protein
LSDELPQLNTNIFIERARPSLPPAFNTVLKRTASSEANLNPRNRNRLERAMPR